MAAVPSSQPQARALMGKGALGRDKEGVGIQKHWFRNRLRKQWGVGNGGSVIGKRKRIQNKIVIDKEEVGSQRPGQGETESL